MKSRFIICISTLYICVICISNSFSATIYLGAGETYTTLESAVSAMSSGDTLIIRDGTYSGTENCLDNHHMPPSGTSSAYTTIRAEHDGMAVFTSGFLYMEWTTSRDYIQIEGLKISGSQTVLNGGTYWKWLRCSFTHEPSDLANDAVSAVSNASYILYEDCWAFGGGRYKFHSSAATLGLTHHIVFRRCVARFDRAHPTQPIAAFTAYRTQYVQFQNCIVIDGDHDEFWIGYEERAPAFYIPHDSEYTSISGCIVINHKSRAWGGLIGNTCNINNSVSCDTSGGWNSRGDSPTYNGAVLKNLSIIVGNTERDAASYGVSQYLGGTGTIQFTNSIVYDQSNYGIYESAYNSIITSDYNVFYANDNNFSRPEMVGVNDYQGASAIDPIDGSPGNGTACLRWIPRIEIGSNCDGTGSDGLDRGANILYRIGISGSHYDEPGYEQVTSTSLWPWPNEDRIKVDMAEYSYTGSIYPSGTSTLTGARGFATGTSIDGSPQTLTKYVWEYLGNQIPADIYGTTSQSHPTLRGGIIGRIQ